MLQGHILDLQRKVLAPALAVVEDVSGRVSVDMDLHDRTVAEVDHRFADCGEVVADFGHVERVQIHLRSLQAQQELGAIAEFELVVLGEGVKVHGAMGGFGGRVVRQLHVVRGVQRLGHTAHDREYARAAAVDHSRFLEGREEVRRVLERDFHLRD